MYFFWYPSSQKAYRVYDLTIRQFFTSGDVVFYENTFSFSTPTPSNYLPSTSIPTVSPDFNDIPIPSSTSHSSLETSISPLSPSSHNFSPSLSNPTHTLSLHYLLLLQNQTYLLLFFFAASDLDNPLFFSVNFIVARLIRHLPLQPCKSSSSCSGTKYQLSNFISYHSLSPSYQLFVNTFSRTLEPTTYKQALCDPKWCEVMKTELTTLENQKTWSLILFSPNYRPIHSKWVFQIKYKLDGSVERYKACLVAEGFIKKEGLDYYKTFALVAKLTTVRCLLALAAVWNWPPFQMDVNNDFLHGALHEELYMILPQGLCQ